MSNQERYFMPTHLNKEPFLSVWWLEDPTQSTVCFIQISEDERHPTWMKFGDVLEMLVRHVPDWENTLLPDILSALKTHEIISPDLIKKYIVR